MDVYNLKLIDGSQYPYVIYDGGIDSWLGKLGRNDEAYKIQDINRAIPRYIRCDMVTSFELER